MTAFGYVRKERAQDGSIVVVGPFDTRLEAEQHANGLEVVEMMLPEATPVTHLPECPCVDGSCCSWIPHCTCQCMCDFIKQVEDRVRAENAQ